MSLTGSYLPSTNLRLSGDINSEFGLGNNLGNYSSARLWKSNGTYTSSPTSMGAFRNASKIPYFTATPGSASFFCSQGGTVNSSGDFAYIVSNGIYPNSGDYVMNAPLGWNNSTTYAIYGYSNYGYIFGPSTPTNFGSVSPSSYSSPEYGITISLRQVVYNPTLGQIMVKVSSSSDIRSPYSPFYLYTCYVYNGSSGSSYGSGYYANFYSAQPGGSAGFGDYSVTSVMSIPSFTGSSTFRIGLGISTATT